METAAAFAGITRATLYNWIRQGQRDQDESKITTLAAHFLNTIKRAQAEGEMVDLAVIGKAALAGQWQAAAWRLERKHPEKWGRRWVEATSAEAGPVQFRAEPSAFSQDQLCRIAQEVLASMPGEPSVLPLAIAAVVRT